MSSIFTGAKMKSYIEIMQNCCKGALPFMEKAAETKEDLIILDLMTSYTIDVIGSLVFGIQCNSFKDPNAEFRVYGKKVFEEFNFIDKLNIFLATYYPKFSSKIGVSNVQKICTKFFVRCVNETVDYRTKNNIKRNDIMQLLIDMRNESQITLDEIVGQTFLFFTAGFETSTKTITYGLFELTKHPEVQERVREEILDVLNRFKGEISLESLSEMKYLDQMIDETIRLYPPLTTITRVCVKDYEFTDHGLKVEKGVKLLIPSLAIHRDSQYYHDPLEFIPERFAEEQKNQPYYGFGIGPRSCIGARFGKIQVKIGLITILRNYRVLLSPNTELPIELDPDNFVIKIKQPLYFKLVKLS